MTGMNHRLRTFLREPLLHFAVLGGLIFGAQRLLAPAAGAGTIAVDGALRRAAIESRSSALKRPLTAAEEEEAVADYLQTELLLREAYRHGLDRNDPVLRERLAAKMGYLLSGEPVQPPEAELEAYFRRHRSRYRRLLSATFEQVYFTGETLTALGRPDSLLLLIREAADPAALGDAAPGGGATLHYDRFGLQRELGSALVSAIETLEPGRWEGPFPSRHGFHYLRVLQKEMAEPLPFEDLQPHVLRDYLDSAGEARLRKAVDSLRTHYRFIYADE
jgi:hypothetical protein